MSPLTGGERVVWITGAAGGLGTALTQAFAASGWRVAAAGHTSLPGQGSASGSSCPPVWPFRLDVRHPDEVDAAVAAILDRWGRLDVLVNNAGVSRDRLLLQTDDASWDHVFEVNLKGAFHCARAALGPMTAQRSGLILNLASFAARSPSAGQAAYASSKAALIGMTLSLAREVGPLGVRVNAVLPGVLPTALIGGLPGRAQDALAAASVLGRHNGLDEVSAAIVRLTEWTGMSGQVIQLDGRIGPWT